MMIDLIDVAVDVQRVIQDRHWQFCFIGGLAVQQWGEPRLTRDVDLSLLTGFGQEAPLVQELLRHFQPRIPDCLEFALRNRVVLLQVPDEVGIDVALAGIPFEVERNAAAWLCRERAWSCSVVPKRVCLLRTLRNATEGVPYSFADHVPTHVGSGPLI